AAARKKYHAAWHAWWEEHAATVDLAQLEGAVLRKPKVFSARASKSWVEHNHKPINAFVNVGWNAGAFAPQWIEADLRASRQPGAIHLEACESGRRQTHEVWLADD